MPPSISQTAASHQAVLDLNTRLFLNSLDAVNDDTAQRRPSDETNNMAFIACHLVDARHFLAKLIGVEVINPFSDVLDEVNSIEEMDVYPPLGDIRTAWKTVSAVLRDGIAALSDEELAQQVEFAFPIDDDTLSGSIAFLLAHEGYHIGQLALLRKYVGLEAMRYT